jgi:hypothetical protein
VRARLAAVAALLAPSPALACAACAAANANRMFLVMTIVLSLLPLAMIGAGLLWIARHARGRLAGEFEEREGARAADLGPGLDPAPPASPPGTPTLMVVSGTGPKA